MILGKFWRRQPAPPDLPALVGSSFVSLGDNCEFGIVQRFCGLEPLGLFRFSLTPLDSLIAALDEDFGAYGAPGDLELATNQNGRIACWSRRYGFGYEVSGTTENEDPDKLLRRETAKVTFLKRKLLEDLASGDRIFVRKGPSTETGDDADRLRRALRRHGPGTLLHVGVAEGREANARLVRDGLIVGNLPRFAPADLAYALDLESWLELCAKAYAIARDLPEAPGIPRSGENLLRRRTRGISALDVAGDGDQPQVFGQLQPLKSLDQHKVYCFSAWVWVPSDFQGTSIAAAVGHFRLGWRDADLSQRDCWQRVWVAAKIPEGYPTMMMGIVIVGTHGSRIWSTGQTLETGPMPEGARPPRSVPRGAA